MIRVFIISPFRAKNGWDLARNIRVAEELSLDVVKYGAVPIACQSMWRNFDRTFNDEFWLRACQSLLEISQLAYTRSNFKTEGCLGEVNRAWELRIPVLECQLDLYQAIQALKGEGVG